MYEPSAILSAIDDHTWPIMIGFTLAMVLQNIAMVTAVLMTRREGWISIPLPCTFLWFAHDLGVVVRYDTWFHTYDHWFLKLFWIGLVTAFLLELVFLAQALKVGRQEYLPDGTQVQWAALLLSGAAMFVLAWEYQKTIWDDPLYQALAATTLYVIPLAVVPLVLRRRSAVAQSPVIYGCFAAMIPLWWGVTAGAYGDAFRTWQYLGSGAVAVVALTGVSVWIARLRAREASVA
ncbi:hypothetical protein F0U44_06265 [Nocardioides humilatus]|uniref:Uncharacterized protein n=1 Tax=Nocardioides humilatus TaxID=2607660 RepID=A0A5B1LP46_9ACTN|nr:hypothetical protein [Nocardioides humilatus]KAA1421868.1 hypothetical protein F0U44_06265 [Nocardioides humilatus]